MALTSVAGGGQSSWFLSEIRAAGLSALRPPDGHQCCHLFFHSPGEKQHIHKQMQGLVFKKKTVKNSIIFCFCKNPP